MEHRQGGNWERQWQDRGEYHDCNIPLCVAGEKSVLVHASYAIECASKATFEYIYIYPVSVEQRSNASLKQVSVLGKIRSTPGVRMFAALNGLGHREASHRRAEEAIFFFAELGPVARATRTKFERRECSRGGRRTKGLEGAGGRACFLSTYSIQRRRLQGGSAHLICGLSARSTRCLAAFLPLFACSALARATDRVPSASRQWRQGVKKIYKRL